MDTQTRRLLPGYPIEPASRTLVARNPRRSRLHLYLLACCLLGFALLLSTQVAAALLANNPEEGRTVLESAREELGKLPEDAKASPQERQLRTVWNRRIELLEEYLALEQTRQELADKQKNLPQALSRAQKLLEEAAPSDAAPPEGNASQAEYNALTVRLQEARHELSQLLALQSTRQQSEESQASRIDALQRRAEAAAQRIELLTQSLATASNEAARRTTELQIENARFNQHLSEVSRLVYREELNWIQESKPLLRMQQESLERQIGFLEQQLAAYNAALQEAIAEKSRLADEALQRKEQAAESATSPEERFIARWEAMIARSQKQQQDLQSQQVHLKKDEAEQSKRLATEKDELLAIKDLISKSEIAGVTADRIKQTLQQIRQRRGLLTRTLRDGAAQQLAEYRSQRFTIEDNLLGLAERFEQEQQQAASQLTEGERQRFQTSTAPLLESYRTALRDEKTVLTELISTGQNLQLLAGQRLEVLNELQRFIRSRAFWLRDARPIGPGTVTALPGELGDALSWLTNLTSREIRNRLIAVVTTPSTLLSALFLFPILPLALYYLRHRIRGVTRQINDRVVAEGRLLYLGVLVIFTALLSSAVLPLYFFIVARLLNSADLPAGIGAVGFQVFDQLALFLFLWFLSRSLFSRRSVAEVQFALPRPAANGLYAALRWFLFGYLIWLMPRNLFLHPPFELEALPRLLYTLFLFSVIVGVIRLVRERSPFIQHQLEQLGNNFIQHYWKQIALVIKGLAVLVLILDVSGHRYASQSILASLAGTLLVILLLPPLYRRLVIALQTLLHPQGSPLVNLSEQNTAAGLNPPADASATSAEPTQAPAEGTHKEGPLRPLVRLLFILAGILTLLKLWGIDNQALRTLDEIQLYTVRLTGAETEFVTAGDFFRCILTLVVTFWLLRIIPGVYAAAVFPRLKMDEGVKYAILTISRYTVFVVGFFFALAAIHLDLGRLGWLMAAIGVGLGFGLQEIVSNFVSGLILLIERPVRPGDVVTIGNLSGKVERINIRATTIVNFDRQEVMVPNRTLITTNVINWTHNDTVNRLVIPIGVAYGSDVDRVRALLLEIARAQPEVLKDPEPSVIFMLHGQSSLDFDLRVFVPSPSEIMPLRDRLNGLINRRLAEEGIEIPFPQRDLHIRSSDLKELRVAVTHHHTRGNKKDETTQGSEEDNG